MLFAYREIVIHLVERSAGRSGPTLPVGPVFVTDDPFVDDASLGAQRHGRSVGDGVGDRRVRDHRDRAFAGDDRSVPRHSLVGVDDAADAVRIASELAVEPLRNGEDRTLGNGREISFGHSMDRTRYHSLDDGLAAGEHLRGDVNLHHVRRTRASSSVIIPQTTTVSPLSATPASSAD